jgi:hypothetical protein
VFLSPGSHLVITKTVEICRERKGEGKEDRELFYLYLYLYFLVFVSLSRE